MSAPKCPFLWTFGRLRPNVRCAPKYPCRVSTCGHQAHLDTGGPQKNFLKKIGKKVEMYYKNF